MILKPAYVDACVHPLVHSNMNFSKAIKPITIKFYLKVKVDNDQEMAQSEKNSHSKKPRWEKN